MPAIAYYLLELAIIRQQGADGALANALGSDVKGKVSPVLYLAGSHRGGGRARARRGSAAATRDLSCAEISTG
jgi:hypothetical protein